MTDPTLTPMMRQYRRIRDRLPPDTILFFRMGDFYEMFFEDAAAASGILEIALTRRQGVPMCGVPFHAANGYLARLIGAGKKVAVCDQVEDPATAHGLVQRELTRIVTPGTVIEDANLESARHNYLAGIVRSGRCFGLALLDVSTGDFQVREVDDQRSLSEELTRSAPGECVLPAALRDDAAIPALLLAAGVGCVSAADDWTFDQETATETLTKHFRVHGLEGFGCSALPLAIRAAGGTLRYVRDDLQRRVEHIRRLRTTSDTGIMNLDATTCRNLDLMPASGMPRSPVGAPPTTLLGVLDTTRTAMGARLLREWLPRPLTDTVQVERRLDAVGTLTADRQLLSELRELLSGIRDIERLLARLHAGGGNARDLQVLSASLRIFPGLRELGGIADQEYLTALCNGIAVLDTLAQRIEDELVDAPPLSIREGGLIRSGISQELDEVRDAAAGGHAWMARYQAEERERTGIKTLKVRFNRVFGFFIEISQGQAAQAPPEYVRKQTLANAERFITPELKRQENLILGAQERANAMEMERFMALREAALAETAAIQTSAAAIARLDVFGAFAERAVALRYNRPRITTATRIRILNGRHPIVEQNLPPTERFVPNDTLLDGTQDQLLLITGPNMAGKSTYIRQVALTVIMAQIGSFVPAEDAEIGWVDRVFTRVGAGDDLARGRSTFMVEMEETANILNHATARSLIVLDEIGRGTSTFDGISIAWSVAEYLARTPRVKARTLFATHYHELTDLALTISGVKNYSVRVHEQNDRIVFLRKIVPGPADKSYGIQVARLAGLPTEVIERAGEILANLEEGEFGERGQPNLARKRPRRRTTVADQLILFGNEDEVISALPG